MKIGDLELGREIDRTYIIAEAGGNHNSDIRLAEEMIIKAASAGVDAIKFQSFLPENLVTNRAVRPGLDLLNPEKLIDVYRKSIRFSQKDHERLKIVCEENKVDFISTPFDSDSVDMLADLGVPAFKVASGDITNYRLLQQIAKKNKPIILSTGASTLDEIKKAVSIIENAGNNDIAILHCILAYPTEPCDANLRSIQYLQEHFPDYIVGLSDHSRADHSMIIPSAAIVLGAKIIEKHYTTQSKDLKEFDHRLSANPSDFDVFVRNARLIESALGKKTKTVFACEEKAHLQMRRSLVASRALKKGTKIEVSDIAMKRPGDGLPASMENVLIGKVLSVDVEFDELFTHQMFK